MTHALTSNGHDASEDGTGRGVPIIAAHGQGGAEIVSDGSPSLTCNHEAPILFSCKDSGNDATEGVAPSMRAMNHKDGNANGGGGLAIAFQARIARNGHGVPSCADSALCADATGDSKPLVCIPIQEVGKRQSGTPQNGTGHAPDGSPMFTLQSTARHGVAVSANQRGEIREREAHGSLSASKSAKQFDGVRQGMHVRRLTPLECERLQGVPDGWTKGFSDSTRYRILGNSVAVPVFEWIAKRIAKL